ncbi:MAG: VTT domain-containing protein [Candidatus Omnitrophica bacterium]|jgi:uncharacterized membrane protein YdjX (TVP38/TMEM64 family)|nr:VTT domain-containing protein [Candidatus Omnitrophota bacterium]MDD5079510.1 VTT domain-containing protein [Candidatus Omnitrophota bacterium]
MAQAGNKDKLKFVIFLAALALLWYLGGKFPVDSNPIRETLSKYPVILSGLVFILAYVTVTFFIWFSKDIFRLIAAVLFGPLLSAGLVLLAETVNAFILFHLARYMGRGYVEHSQQKGLKSWDRRLANAGLPWLFIFRSAPLIPFRFMDLAMGLTGISFRKYLLIVLLGSFLRILWIQYVLAGVGQAALGDPKAIAQYFNSHSGIFVASLIYLALAIAVLVKLKHKE